jgi:Ala-tRNA(Pro) deacylase
MSTADLTRKLDRDHVDYEVIRHRRTETAGEEAVAIGIAPSEVAKTLVLATDDGYVRVVLTASERLDLAKAREALGGGKEIRFATEAELAAAYPMFELGAVPPFGGPAGDRTLVDRCLAERKSVVLEAGSHEASVRIATSDLIALCRADIADLCED